LASVKFTAVLESAEEGGFVIRCVELPVATQGESKEEALANLKEAIEGYLEVKADRLREQTKGERVEVIVEAPSALMA
jgi:predicted RNase H-like HicB family nuclease